MSHVSIRPWWPARRTRRGSRALSAGVLAVGAGAFLLPGLLPAVVSRAPGGHSIIVFGAAYAALAPVLANLTPQVPCRSLLVGTTCVLGLAGLLTAVAQGTPAVFAGRILAAAGAAACTSIAMGTGPPVRRARTLAVTAGGMAGATLLGLAIGYGGLPAPHPVGAGEVAAALVLFVYGLAAALGMVLSERRGIGAERRRIARELHDSLTHAIVLIRMKAGTAVHLQRMRGEQVPETLLAIRDVGDDAMRELRATLHVLRSTDDEASRSGLHEIGRLVVRTRSAGMFASLTISGPVRTLPADVDRAAYRIVQEALTNVARHAHDASASVYIGYEPDSLTVRVDDDGGPAADVVPGMGLTGMRERVTALGGLLRTGPRPEGGFAVHAELPVARIRTRRDIRQGLTPGSVTMPPAAYS